MWPKTTKAGPDSINGLLPGLVAVSCLSAGWLLGYGLSPSIGVSTTSPTIKVSSGKSSMNVPADRQEWVKSSGAQKIKSNGFGK